MTLPDNNDKQTDFPMNRSVSGKGLPTSGMDADAQIEAVRECIIDEIESAKSLIHQQIAMLRTTQQDSEMEGAISQLENQIRHLDGQAFAASTGSIAALMSLSRTMPNMVANNVRVSATAQTEAAYQSATIIYEMTEHQIEYYHAQHDKQAHTFESYEQRSSGNIEELAEANGTDITAYLKNRGDLLKEKQEAKAKGDRLGMFEADALLAANNSQGLRIAGADTDKLVESEKQAEAARQRYLKEVEMKARKEAKEAGLSQGDSIDHIARSRLNAETDFDKRVKELEKSNGVVTAQDKAVMVNDDAISRAKSTKQNDGTVKNTKVKDKELANSISLDDSPDAETVVVPPVPDHSPKNAKHK